MSKQYTYGHDLISQRQGPTIRFYQYDGHGSVRQLTDASASVTDTYAYDAFGTLIERTGTTDNNYLYTGERWDLEAKALRSSQEVRSERFSLFLRRKGGPVVVCRRPDARY